MIHCTINLLSYWSCDCGPHVSQHVLQKVFCLFSLIFYSHQQSHRLLTLFVFSDVLVFFTWGQEFVCFGIWSWWCVQVLNELQRATCYKWVVRHYWILDWEVTPAHTSAFLSLPFTALSSYILTNFYFSLSLSRWGHLHGCWTPALSQLNLFNKLLLS